MDKSQLYKQNLKGYKLGYSMSIPWLSGAGFSTPPVGYSININTPHSFLSLGPLNSTISLMFGQYRASFGYEEYYFDYDFGYYKKRYTKINIILLGIGANIKLFNFFDSEIHIGRLDRGLGFHLFSGISFERFLKNRIKLPINLKFGNEIFFSNDIDNGHANGWMSLSLKAIYNF